MQRKKHLILGLIFWLWGLVGLLPAGAAPVGTFTLVEGQVDLLRAGKLPATPARVQDPVAVGDVVRTKSLSRAQIRFVDHTVLSIAPESRVTIEEYLFDGAKGERQATLQILRGLVHTAVEKVFPREEPDFVIKTHTAVLGVRGTRWYTKLLPLSTDVYTEEGQLEVRNLLPEIIGVQVLQPLQFSRVSQFLPPTLPLPITPQDLKHLEEQMKTGLGAGAQSNGGPGGTQGPPLAGQYFGAFALMEELSSGMFVPPRIGIPPLPPEEPPPPSPRNQGYRLIYRP